MSIKWFPPMGIFERARGRSQSIKHSGLRTDKKIGTMESFPRNTPVTPESTFADDGCPLTVTATSGAVKEFTCRTSDTIRRGSLPCSPLYVKIASRFPRQPFLQ